VRQEEYSPPRLVQNAGGLGPILHRIFEQNARERPARNAVSFGGKHLTYAELNNSANELAHWLTLNGIKAEHRVAVCLRPGFEIIIVLLAIQKAGGVYVPIDPDYPKARIRSIVDDAAPDLTITQDDVIRNLHDILPHPHCYQETKGISQDANLDNPDIHINEDSTAYIFYTSGTTGVPKGIPITYTGLTFYVLSAVNQFGMRPDDTTLTIAKFSFSISLFDLMTSVISGGRLVVLPRDAVMDYARLSAALEHATFVHIGPNLLKGLVQYIKKNYLTFQPFAGLRHVSSGGDFVPADLLEDLKCIFGRAEIYVIYGCTEIACMGCFYLVPRDVVVDKSYIGTPFVGMEVVLLNDEGEKAVDSTIGEICFKGTGITKGYLNRPELNEKAFVEIDGTTYFRTGDIARRDLSGNLEYLGRRDFQIKLRGQRVELIEIETHLRNAPGIRDAIVAAPEIGITGKRLTAYITLEDTSSFNLDSIRRYLHDQLPDYMQPSGWIVLEKMPLNENFKIARKALPDPTLKNLIVTEPYAAPRNDLERILVEIWQKALDIPRIGINDDFFSIGGDSLAAMTISMLAAEKGINIAPLQLVHTPTVSSLVEAGVRHLSEATEYSLNTQSSGSLSDLPPFILRFLYERGSEEPHRWNISRILVAKTRLSSALVEKSFRYLGERHDALRLRFHRNLGRWEASVLDTSEETLVFRVVDLSGISETDHDKAKAEVFEACQSHVNLTHGPIAFLVLFELGKERSQELFFVVHHFSMDVVSWKTFWLEFEAIYRRLEEGGERALPDVPASFKTWTHVLRPYANSEKIEAAAKSWASLNWSELPKLPKDFAAGCNVNTNESAKVLRRTLTEGETDALLRSVSHGFDVERLLISGLAVVLSRWRGSEYVHFDRLVHGRDVAPPELNLSRTMGCIIAYAPMVLRINRLATLSEILLSVSEQLRRTGDSGTGVDLYRYFGSNTALAHQLGELPRAEVLFNFRGKVDDIIERSSLFTGTREISGFDHNPNGLRQYPFSFVVDIMNNRLEIRLVYSSNLHDRKTVEVLFDEYVDFLRSVVSRPLLS
jgi:amino acid adenylation domain-containing protein/non-ribosomal peptide synthase protein (TIGR01720 family)